MKTRSTHAAIRWTLALLILGAAGSGVAKDSRNKKKQQSGSRTLPDFYVANWNVENLFDTRNDPKNKYDDEFLPNNVTTRWTQVRLDTKLDNLARVIQTMNHGKGPDILGLQEVEHQHLVKKLAKRIKNKTYRVAHAESRDRRGIDTALIYNFKKFTLENIRTYKVHLRWGGKTRDILHTELKDKNGDILHVFVNHWPSRGGGIEASDPKRFSAARTLSKAISRIFKENKKAHIIVLGDFNDEPSSKSVSGILQVNPYPSKSGYKPDKLYNLTSKKSAKGQGTYFHSYRGKIQWRMYDQIIVSGTLLNNATIDYDRGSMEIAGPSFMISRKGHRKGAPYSTFGGGDRYLGGYSDHMPIGARFTYPDSQKSTQKSGKKAKKDHLKPTKAQKSGKQSKKTEKPANQSKQSPKPSPKAESDPPSPEKDVVYF